MKRIQQPCLAILLLVMLLGGQRVLIQPSQAQTDDSWWDEAWPYRVSVETSGEKITHVNLDFTAIFTALGLGQALLDLRSIRVVPLSNGFPGTPLPYSETYSTLLFDGESLNLDFHSSDPYWTYSDQTSLSIDSTRFTQGTSSLKAFIQVKKDLYVNPYLDYTFNGTFSDWSAYESLIYDVWPQVNQTAIDQAPDLYFLRLIGALNCPWDKIKGPALVMNQWNAVSTSLKPYGVCPKPNLTTLEALSFFLKKSHPLDPEEGLFEDGDEVWLWLDNLRLVDQNGPGEIRWETLSGITHYDIYFDTLDHEGHPPPLLASIDSPTSSAKMGNPESGGYFHQIEGTAPGNLTIWTAPTVEKISKTKQAPVFKKPLVVQAARGELEAFQVVVNSPSSESLRVFLSDFLMEEHVIPSSQVDLFRVDYLTFTQISDYYGRLGEFPDPLYPFSSGANVFFPGGLNQPLWFRVRVPDSAAPGTYTSTITIGNAIIPLSLEVWNFNLPKDILLPHTIGFDRDLVLELYKGTLSGIPQNCFSELSSAIDASLADYRLIPFNPANPPDDADIHRYTLTAYEVLEAKAYQAAGDRIWWEYAPTDTPPFPNIGVMDRPGMDARILPWIAWLERVDGLFYPQSTDWAPDPWLNAWSNDSSNGDGFLFYPPKDKTLAFDPCISSSNRLVTSIRLENLREGIEDYAYLWLLDNGQPADDDTKSQADLLAGSLIGSRTDFSHVPFELINLRQSIALLLAEPIPNPEEPEPDPEPDPDPVIDPEPTPSQTPESEPDPEKPADWNTFVPLILQ